MASVIGAVVFFLLNLPRILQHAMWRDELQAWMIARESGSLLDIFGNLRYEGHPGLWHCLLWIVTQFTSNPVGMQILHLGIGTATVYLLLRASPFRPVEKALLCLSYFLSFEYLVISRSYSLSALLLFLFCALVTSPGRRNLPWAWLSLGLLSNTNIFGLILAMSGSVYLLRPSFVAWGESGSRKERIGLVLGGVGGIALSILAYQTMNQVNAGHPLEAFVRWDPARAHYMLRAFVMPFFPIPQSVPDFWNSWIFASLSFSAMAGLAALTAFVLWQALSRDRATRLFFWMSALGILVFCYLKYTGWIRHHGMIYLAFIAALWLSRPRRPRWILALLALQAFAGVEAGILHLRAPFSAARETAAWIRQSALFPGHAIVGHVDHATSSVAAYLDSPIHYAENGKVGMYVRWTPDRHLKQLEPILAQARSYLGKRPGVLILMTFPFEDALLKKYPDVSFLTEFTRSVVPDERYWVYEMH